MSLIEEFHAARRAEDLARLRRVFALRALRANGFSQSRIAQAAGVSQPAISQQLRHAPEIEHLLPQVLLEAAAPALRALADDHGYTRLAVFGSVARGEAGPNSDIDLLVEPPPGTSTFGLLTFKRLIEHILGREVDLITYGGLSAIDDDIRGDAVLL